MNTQHKLAPGPLLALTLALLFSASPCFAEAGSPSVSSASTLAECPRLGILERSPNCSTLVFRGTRPGQILRLYGRWVDPDTSLMPPWETLALIPTDGLGQARLNLPKGALSGWTLRVRGVGSALCSVDLLISGQPWTPPGVIAGSLPDRERSRGSGEIIVSEIMKDPAQVSDAQGEWFEVFNTTNGPIDMEGWILADLGSDMTLLDNGGLGIIVPARGYLVLGREIDPQFNGGVQVDAVWSSFILAHGADEVLLARPNGSLVDLVAYGSAPGWVDPVGASLQLCTDRLAVNWNDSPDHWCEAPVSWAGGDLGSPGVLNPPCP